MVTQLHIACDTDQKLCGLVTSIVKTPPPGICSVFVVDLSMNMKHVIQTKKGAQLSQPAAVRLHIAQVLLQ